MALLEDILGEACLSDQACFAETCLKWTYVPTQEPRGMAIAQKQCFLTKIHGRRPKGSTVDLSFPTCEVRVSGFYVIRLVFFSFFSSSSIASSQSLWVPPDPNTVSDNMSDRMPNKISDRLPEK